MSVWFDSDNRTVYLCSKKTSYVLFRDGENRLLNLYWGRAVPPGSLCYNPADYCPVASFDLPLSLIPHEIPVCGRGWNGFPSVALRNSAGDDVVDLRVTEWEAVPGKPALPGLPATYVEKEEEADTLIVRLRDPDTGIRVTAAFSVFADTGAVTRSLTVENDSSAPVVLTGLLSASVPFWSSAFDVIHLKGAWARERSIVRTPLGQGEYRIASRRGASGHEENPFIAFCEQNADEFSGSVWALSLVYSGSFTASGAVDNAGHARLSIGLNPDVFSWTIAPGESFTGPEAVMVYSGEGLNGMSQTYHRLYRSRLARGFWRDRPRPVLINNWEGTYFDFNEEKLLAIATEAAKLGVELFVLDDGWFGKRNSDNCSLGDWVVNTEKLPHGLSGLSERIHALGLRFGLWFEPEMVSPDSDLYRAHPDWCLHVPCRTRTESRNQLILDLGRQEVQEYIIRSVSSVLGSAGIDYVKWDMNRNMTEAVSAVLPQDRKGETMHRYMLGLYRVLEAVTSAYPDVLFESCSGGGGRFDPGMLYYMPQTWTSDDTDAVERLKLQYGTSVVYPASAMGAHVSAVPNHQTGRSVNIRMRGDVAIGGNFGFELDLTALSPEELSACREMVSEVKKLRSLTQTGTFWRLVSPFKESFAAWSFVSEDGSDVLFCAYRVLAVPNTPPVRVRLYGLNPSAVYEDGQGRSFSGAALMAQGYSVRLNNDFSSEVVRFRVK